MKAQRIATLFALCIAAASGHADPVRDGFERMLTHAATTTTVARPAEPADPLIAALVAPLREPRSANRRADDPVLAGFVRMLQHESTHTRAPVPAGTDPLVAALIEPVRDGHAPRTMLAASPSAAVR